MPAQSPANDIYFRTSIGACNHDGHIRVYMQDVIGKFREAMYERDWSNGTEKNVVAAAKIDSPLAVASMELKQIRLFYLTPNNMVKESVYDHTKGWREGDMGKMEIHTAPYSMITADHCASLSGGRLYVQLPDNTIQEFGFSDESSGWKKMANLGPALPGTAITCTSFKRSRLSMRVYFQDVNQTLKEKCFDEGRSWYDGSFKVLNSNFVPLRASLACTSYNIALENIGIHVFFVTAKGLQEMVFDGKWREGKLGVDCIIGSEVAVTSWGTGKDLQLRVYFQKGEHVSGISEWVCKQDKWEAGKRVLPPA